MSNEKLIKNFRVDSERDNKLLFRKEIKYTVDFKSGKTVSRNEIKKLLMDYYKAKEDVIVVDRNIQETGKDSLKGYVKIYDTYFISFLHLLFSQIVRRCNALYYARGISHHYKRYFSGASNPIYPAPDTDNFF